MNNKYKGESPSANNAFVQAEQNALKPMGGKEPKMDPAMMKFDAYMENDGDHAKSFTRSLTAGLDKKAFPVK